LKYSLTLYVKSIPRPIDPALAEIPKGDADSCANIAFDAPIAAIKAAYVAAFLNKLVCFMNKTLSFLYKN
jgi:hypothetical protein